MLLNLLLSVDYIFTPNGCLRNLSRDRVITFFKGVGAISFPGPFPWLGGWSWRDAGSGDEIQFWRDCARSENARAVATGFILLPPPLLVQDAYVGSLFRQDFTVSGEH